jgi:hypothetical protein
MECFRWGECWLQRCRALRIVLDFAQDFIRLFFGSLGIAVMLGWIATLAPGASAGESSLQIWHKRKGFGNPF